MLDDHQALAQARKEYAYPPFCLKRSALAADGTAVLWGIRVVIHGPSQTDSPNFAGYSSFDLDQYHHGLLRSDNDDDVLLGVASVMFWGFARGPGGRYTTGRALSKAKNVAGLGKLKADRAAEIIKTIRNVLSLLDIGKRQEAIRDAMTLRFHGLAFASKLLAFSAPETECVYDEVISLRLKASEDPRLKNLYVATAGQHHLAEKAAAYEGWAELCAAKATDMNSAGVCWTDWNSTNRVWRAVDVERAYFSLGRF